MIENSDYYSPREIYFSREQCIWLIFWLPMLIEGDWPPAPQGSGYTEIIQASHSHRAKFETPCQFAAEIESRLKTTKEAGEALVHEVQNGLSQYDLLSPPAKRVLNYISGWRRRSQTYSQWKYEQENRKKSVFIRKS